MKALLFILLVLQFGCDTPTRNRYIDTEVIQGQGVDGGTEGTFQSVPPSGATETAPTNNGQSQANPGYETCNLTFNNYAQAFGSFGLCQQTTNERGFKFSFQKKYPSKEI